MKTNLNQCYAMLPPSMIKISIDRFKSHFSQERVHQMKKSYNRKIIVTIPVQ